MKIATHVVLFGQDKWIMRNIENAYPHVDMIYIAYSDKPWNYNPNAKHLYKNSFDLNIIKNSKFIDKIKIIEGVWATEEDQRNTCVDAALNDDMDYLIIHDADEFYSHFDFSKLVKYIEDNPNYDYYKVGWYCFWKSFNYILLDELGNKITGYPEFCINLKNGVRFQSKRRPNKNNYNVIPLDRGICYHGSYVLTDEEVKQKINTWGHTNDFNKDHWYNNVWLKWTPEMKNLHLVHPPAWSKAIKFDEVLPVIIEDMR
jgi:hypothetical protein